MPTRDDTTLGDIAMGAFNADGTRITRGAFPATPVAETDPAFTLDQDVYADFAYQWEKGGNRTGRAVWKRAGATVRESEIDALYESASLSGVSPTSGPAAGGTTITLSGEGLTGVTAVSVGGAAATSVTVVNPQTVTAVTGSRAAGAGLDVVATDDSGSVTLPGAFTYTA